jgi:hypothetical protein
MPYIQKEKRPELDRDYMKATEPGDLTYVFSKFFYKLWLQEPRWTTYHNLETLLLQPDRNQDFQQMYSRLTMSTHFGIVDVRVAARLALNELFWRCVRKYEDGKKIANGDVFKEVIAEVK